jgi:hypothetical protein
LRVGPLGGVGRDEHDRHAGGQVVDRQGGKHLVASSPGQPLEAGIIQVVDVHQPLDDVDQRLRRHILIQQGRLQPAGEEAAEGALARARSAGQQNHRQASLTSHVGPSGRAGCNRVGAYGLGNDAASAVDDHGLDETVPKCVTGDIS